ncbi:MAG: MarR family transcriptional regulator [Oscillospiraceae bacterium]|nr:MarR family transcriptional regulator [Oscillospiraceae bacterium]
MSFEYHEAMKLANQLCFPLYAAARNVTGLYTPWLKPLGLTYTQYIVFLVLWERDGISVSEIGERLMLDNGTLSPLLKKMEQAGYVERRRCREDDRVVEITLTEKGRALQEQAKDIPQKVAGCVDLPAEKAQQLYALLYELLENQGYEKTKHIGGAKT